MTESDVDRQAREQAEAERREKDIRRDITRETLKDMRRNS